MLPRNSFLSDLCSNKLNPPHLLLGTVISRSEQGPGSGFHPRDVSTKNDWGFLGPYWCDTKKNRS